MRVISGSGSPSMRYFPFDSDDYAMTMNARAGVGSLIEVGDDYLSYLALKDQILSSDDSYYSVCPSNILPLAWETLELLLPDMAAYSPQYFSLDRHGDIWTWTNSLIGATTTFRIGDDNSLPRAPLDWLGRQVQEDLILMAETPDSDSVCVGGHLCFGASWCLPDKIGQSFLRIHEDVPEFGEKIGRPADLLMRRLKPGRPVERLNWTISYTDQLNMAPRVHPGVAHLKTGITAENAGERVFLRVERQTLSRLPKTRGILFTIRTYIDPVSTIAADPAQLRRFASVLRGVPPTTIAYKNMMGYYGALMAHLDTRTMRHNDTRIR